MSKRKMVCKCLNLPAEVLEILDKLLDLSGQNFSEYTRNLIIKDLDQRSVFTTTLKERLVEVHSNGELRVRPHIEAKQGEVPLS
jgi:hypothetical protein